MTRAIRPLFVAALLSLVLYPVVLMAQQQGGSSSTLERKLVVGVLHDPPYIIRERNGEWTGLNVDIWKAVAQDLKIDYAFKEMGFQELIDALKQNRIDISIEAFFMMAERQRLFDFSIPLGNTRLGVATLPEKMSHPWWAAVKIFLSWGTLKTVGLLCLLLCVLGFLFWLIERRANADHFGGGTIKGIGSGIYWVGSTLASGVCFGVMLKSLPARILGLIWMLACAIALSALIASLTASLYANRSMVETVNGETLRHVHLGGIRGSAESITLENLGGKYTLYQDEEGALKAVLAGDIEGFLYDEITLHYYKDNEYREQISVYPTSSRRFSFAFGLPKDSPLRRPVSSALLTLMERPDWGLLLTRYGLGEDFAERPAPQMNRRRPQ